jgi:colicin import membrane protein
LLADKKTEEPPKPEAPKEEDKKPDPPKQEPPKPAPPKPAPPRADPAKEALAKLRAQAKPSPGEVKVKPNAVAQALATARKQSGGGGGEGAGEGGGGIGDVYGAQIVMAVQPNWHWPAQAKGNLSVVLYLKIDAAGRVLDVRVEESSGNAVFDSSAVTAVRVTQVLPPPPSPAYREIILGFFPMQ